MSEDPNHATNDVSTPAVSPVSSWASAASSGAFAGALAGMMAGYGDGKLGIGGFIVFLLLVSSIKPGSRKALAIFLFVIVAALCAALIKIR